MKAIVVRRFGEWVVAVRQDHQEFFLCGGTGCTKEEAQWFAKMFRIALAKHDAAKAKRP